MYWLHAVVETMGVVLSWCIACRLWQEFGLIFCRCSQVLHGLQRWERFLLGVLGSCCKCPDLGTSLLPSRRTSVLAFGCCCTLPMWWCYSLGMLVGWIGGLRWSQFRGFSGRRASPLDRQRDNTMRLLSHLEIPGFQRINQLTLCLCCMWPVLWCFSVDANGGRLSRFLEKYDLCYWVQMSNRCSHLCRYRSGLLSDLLTIVCWVRWCLLETGCMGRGWCCQVDGVYKIVDCTCCLIWGQIFDLCILGIPIIWCNVCHFFHAFLDKTIIQVQ